MKTITIRVDQDNDIYEMQVTTINETVTYTNDNVYDSEYSQLFDDEILKLLNRRLLTWQLM